MRRCNSFLAFATITMLTLVFYGCGEAPDTSSSGPTNTTTDVGDEHAVHEGHADHDLGDEAKTDMEKVKEELAKLSEEDRASAEEQQFCPVSDKMLGSMKAPIKVDVDGQNVWICCAGCKDTLLEDPETHLAKLKK